MYLSIVPTGYDWAIRCLLFIKCSLINILDHIIKIWIIIVLVRVLIKIEIIIVLVRVLTIE